MVAARNVDTASSSHKHAAAGLPSKATSQALRDCRHVDMNGIVSITEYGVGRIRWLPPRMLTKQEALRDCRRKDGSSTTYVLGRGRQLPPEKVDKASSSHKHAAAGLASKATS
jgi:hypothetical protein